MGERSPLISLALLAAPLFSLVALQTILPGLDSVISNDILSKIIVYGFSLFLGILMILKYNVVEDHEYHRSKAIRKLSKSYKLENKGIWEDSDQVMRDLELKAKKNSKDKISLKSEKLMKGKIGNINNESSDEGDLNEFEVSLEMIPDKVKIEDSDYEVRKTTLFSKFKSKLDKFVDKAALKQIDKIQNNIKPDSYPEINKSSVDDKWNTSGSKKMNKVVICNSCQSLNDGDKNYCSVCGDYLSRQGNV
jgi:hypothetical protein